MTFTLYRIHLMYDKILCTVNGEVADTDSKHHTEIIFDTNEAYRRLWHIQKKMEDVVTYNNDDIRPKSVLILMESALVLPGSDNNWNWEICSYGGLHWDDKNERYRYHDMAYHDTDHLPWNVINRNSSFLGDILDTIWCGTN